MIFKTKPKPRIVSLKLGYEPDAVEDAQIYTYGNTVYLYFLATLDDAESTPIIATFQHALIHRYGYPNDEAIRAHPILKDSKDSSVNIFYSILEIENSPWLSELTNQNTECFPNESFAKGARHFVITFKDATFECIAWNIELKPTTLTFPEAIRQIK